MECTSCCDPGVKDVAGPALEEYLGWVRRCHGDQVSWATVESFPDWAGTQDKAEPKLAFELGTQCQVFSPPYWHQEH